MTLVLVLAAAWTLGRLTFYRHFPDNNLMWGVIHFQAGLCLAGTLGWLVGMYSMAAAQYVLGAIAVGGLLWTMRRTGRNTERRVDLSSHATGIGRLGYLGYTCALALGLVVLLSFMAALVPETAEEATSYTLALAQQYAQAGQFHFATGNEHAAYPHLGYVLYGLVYFRGSALMLSLLAWCFGALVCVQLYYLGRQIHGPWVALVGCAFATTAPIFWGHWAQAGTLLLGAGFLGSALLLLLRRPCAASTAEPTKKDAVLAGMMLGGALAVLPYAWIGVGPMLLLLCRKPAWSLRGGLLLPGVALLCLLPWLGRNFGHLGWNLEAVTAYFALPKLAALQLPVDWESVQQWLWLPWDLVMRPEPQGEVQHVHAIWILLLVVPGFVCLDRQGRRVLGVALLAAGPTWLITGSSAALLPYLMLLGPVAAQVLANLGTLRRWVMPAVVALLVFQAFFLIHMHYPALQLLAGRIDPTSYLHRAIDHYPIYTQANALLTSEDRLLLPLPHAGYIQGAVHADRLWMEALADQPLEVQIAALKTAGITAVLAPVQYEIVDGWLPEETHAMLMTWCQQGTYFERDPPLDVPRQRGRGMYRFYWLRLRATPDGH